MLKVWLEIIPTLVDFYPYMKKYSYLYLTCPEAAILNLSKSFETTLNVIFGYSPRSEEFMRTSSNILSNSKVLSKPKTKKIALVQVYFIDAFTNAGCLKSMTNLIQSSQISKSSDFSTVLGLLSVIAPTFTRVTVSHDDAVEFEKAINAFLFEEGAGVIQMIRQLPEAQIKDLKEDDILNVIKAYYEQNEKALGKEEYLAKAQLDMLLVFLQSPYIDKKLTALNEIKKMFDKRNKLKEVPSRTLAEWLSKSQVIEYIYQEAKHPELISRSADLIIILAENNKLKEETLEMLWENCINEHKHEAVTESTLNVVASIAKSLDSKMIDLLLDHIHKLPLNMLGEYISILKLFYINCFENLRLLHGKSRAEKDMSEKVKLENLWKAVQDDAILSEKNKLITLDVLIELMHMFDLSNTSQFLGYAVESLKEGNSSVK